VKITGLREAIDVSLREGSHDPAAGKTSEKLLEKILKE
jgi:hypothetical protein